MDSKSDTKVTIKIPRPLYNSLKKLVADSGFNSVNDFIVYILRDIASITKTDVNGQNRYSAITKWGILALR